MYAVWTCEQTPVNNDDSFEIVFGAWVSADAVVVIEQVYDFLADNRVEIKFKNRKK